MKIDLSFEYDCCYDEFKGPFVAVVHEKGLWISFHTSSGEECLKTFGINIEIPHKRIKLPYSEAREIYLNASKEISKSFGGFYWSNLKHTKHVGA